jgi:tol-pal system protein YbgF
MMPRGAFRSVLAMCVWVVVVPAMAADSEGAPVVTVTGQANGSSLESRVSKLERVLSGQALTELLTRIQHLQEDVQKLRGDLEVQGNDINGIKQRQRDLYLDIDRRLQQLEASNATKSTTASSSPPLPTMSAQSGAPGPGANSSIPAMNPPMPGMMAPSSTQPNSDEEQAAYEKAFNLLRDGHYDDAIAAFQDMLSKFPGGKLSDNAQYWIGEADFAARRFREASDEFNKVIKNYPQSPKVPDAMLKLGFSYYELSDWAKTRSTLEQLEGRYPQSTAAQLADKRLQKMKSEGH